MLFFLKKVLTFWVLPLPLSLLLLGLGLWFSRARSRRPRVGRTLLVAGFLLLLLCSNKAISRALIGPLESRHPALVEVPASLPQDTLIVVLGGGHGDSRHLPPSVRLSDSALGRLTEGLRLARALPGSKVLVSGPSDGQGGATHASVLASAAVALGLDPTRLLQIDQARDTEDEARTVAKTYPGRQILLVTSAWHMPRAAALFKAQGLSLHPAPADFRAKAADHVNWRDYGWDSESLTRSTMAIREYLGLLWLKLRGRI